MAESGLKKGLNIPWNDTNSKRIRLPQRGKSNMTKRVKKDTSNASYGLSRWFRKLYESKPSATVLIIVVLAGTLFLLGGGIFQATAGTPATVYYGGKFYFVYTSTLGGNGLDGQLGMDTVISGMLYAFGLIGLLLMYQSTKNAYKPRQAYIALIVGVTLLAFAYIFLEAVVQIKLG